METACVSIEWPLISANYTRLSAVDCRHHHFATFVRYETEFVCKSTPWKMENELQSKFNQTQVQLAKFVIWCCFVGLMLSHCDRIGGIEPTYEQLWKSEKLGCSDKIFLWNHSNIDFSFHWFFLQIRLYLSQAKQKISIFLSTKSVNKCLFLYN